MYVYNHRYLPKQIVNPVQMAEAELTFARANACSFDYATCVGSETGRIMLYDAQGNIETIKEPNGLPHITSTTSKIVLSKRKRRAVMQLLLLGMFTIREERVTLR